MHPVHEDFYKYVYNIIVDNNENEQYCTVGEPLKEDVIHANPGRVTLPADINLLSIFSVEREGRKETRCVILKPIILTAKAIGVGVHISLA